jgi:nicotine oxidoreductase
VVVKPDYDVIVIGAGFAGATAARECATRGLRTLVLEGRDRLGGRTWTSQLSDGEVVEIGGTYVHWSQPNIWSEIIRYGLAGDVVEAGVEPEWALVPSGSALAWRPFAEFAAWEKTLLERVFEPSRVALPRPYDPLSTGERVATFDKMSVRDRLNQLDLVAADDAYLSGLFGMESSNSPDKASFLSLMRWWACAGHSYEGMQEAVYGYKLANGIVGLLQAIITDGGAEVRLGSPVSRIESLSTTVHVTTVDGEVATAAAAVVATPVGIWPRIEFAPALSAERIEAAREGLQAPCGSKIIAVLRGESRRFYIQPDWGHPIGFMWTSHMRGGDEQVAAIFGSPSMRDPNDPDQLIAAVQDLLPDVEVVESVAGTYLEGDEFANGAWPFLQPGQLCRFAPHVNFTRPEGRLAFASSEIAAGWCGFVEGAVESGLQAARTVRDILR